MTAQLIKNVSGESRFILHLVFTIT